MDKFIFALYSFKSAWDFTHKHRLWGYYVIPALISLLLFSTLLFFISQLATWASAIFMTLLPTDWVSGGWLSGLLSTVIFVIALLLCFKIYRYVMLMLLSPALALLSERVQQIWHDTPEKPFDMTQLIADVLRGIQISIRNLVIELFLTITLTLIGLILSPLSPIIALLIFVIESYFVGFAMIDYRNEFLRLTARQSREIIWQHKSFSVGIGMTFNILLWIPVVGVLVAPLLAVTAAGIGINQLADKE
jgi:CysZ protein